MRLIFKNNTYIGEYGTLLTLSISDDELAMDVSIGTNLSATFLVEDQKVQHGHYYRIQNGVVRPSRSDPTLIIIISIFTNYTI